MEQSNLNAKEMPKQNVLPSVEDYSHLLEQLEALTYENQALSNVNTLVAGVAHEIKNPLTIMKGFLQLIKPDLDKLQKSDIADLLLTEIQRTTNLVEEFLQLARPAELTSERIDLIPFLKNILLLFHSHAKLSKCDLTTNLQQFKLPIEVMINPGQFKQVFLNVMKNSIEAIRMTNRSNGVISLTVGQHFNGVTIAIRDNGVGMDASTQSRIFKPFYTTKEKGTGLGLFLSKQIIQNHKGTIKVKSSPSFGTTFSIHLPLLHPV
ncbi:GHKL domain-containing protein [Bacillus hwajinpoensis]|uniref:histidine kinase n=1 Tax=Guptibacillus hwajinpoensis TaxID=208199 RepID=A0A845F179_9BACL|nr:ATP-binding protein [Pseudalkalibacillus hwajinpoensis]MYL64633.1 GHKL domain-containing protein [Pseudalkalibacillus hwajinpoensis]